MREALSCSGDTIGDCGKIAGDAGATSAGKAADAGAPSTADAGCVMPAGLVVAAAAATG